MILKKISLTFIVMLSVLFSAMSQVKIAFEVSFTEPQAHYADVQMQMSGIVKDYIDVKMPVWQPGSYLIREFSKNVEFFTATAAGNPVRVSKINKNTWRIYSEKAAEIKVNYKVYAFEVSVRTSFVDDSHAFLSPTGIFMYPDGYLKSPSTVKINPPKNWAKVSTGLASIDGLFTYYAPDFDILFDSPIEVGNQDVFEFTASGVRHEVAMYGGGNYDKEKLKKDMARIVEYQTNIFGENPNKHYVFIVHNFESGRGGLEHLNSTTLGATRNGYNIPGIYFSYLRLVAHEYFHLWNIKRMRPVALGPFDYENENYTTNLWISEGYTTYYSTKSMLKAGFSDTQGFLNTVAASISGIENSIGGKQQSASASSFDTWIIQYRPNENSSNNSISYYSKGEVIGILMDLEIIHATKGAKSLDDVMKAMYLKGEVENKGFTDAEFKAMVEKISGVSFTDFWAKYVDGTEEVAYEKYLGYAGLKVKDEGVSAVRLGAVSKKEGDKVLISTVARGSAAWNDGLNVNDEILLVDGKAPEAILESMKEITEKKVGDVIKFTIVRSGITRDILVKLTAYKPVKLAISMDPNATALQKEVLKKWTQN